MSNVTRITKRAALHAERAHDAFDIAIADGTVSVMEIERLKFLLDEALISATTSDLGAQIAVSGARGSIAGRHHQDLTREFIGLVSQLPPVEQVEDEPLFPDAA